MPRPRAMPSDLLRWIEAQPPGSIMRPDTFRRIKQAAYDRLRAKGVPDEEAHPRAVKQAGSAYWRAAVKKYFLATGKLPDKKERRRRMKKNPVLAVMGNPRAGEIFSLHVHAITYTHKGDGLDYKHEFAEGVHMRANRDGSITLYHPDKAIWRDFP